MPPARPGEPGQQHLAADATWTTDDGYVVHRTITGGVAYWVREKAGRFARHLTLTDAKAGIDWLRAQER